MGVRKYITGVLKDEEVVSLLNKLYERSGNLIPFFIEKVVPQMRMSVAMNFNSGGRPFTWNPLSNLTISNKRAGGFSTAKLIKIGNLKNSIGSYLTVSKKSLHFGTNLSPYSTVHQYGKIIKPVTRQFLAIPLSAAVNMGISSPTMLEGKTFVRNNIIFLKEDKGAKAMFILKKSVRIPRRPYMVWQPSDINKLASDLLNYVLNYTSYKNLSTQLVKDYSETEGAFI